MYDFILFILVIISIVILIVSLVYITRASVAISGTNDPHLQQAHTYLAWTSGVLWTLIALFIIGSILLVVFGPEFLPLIGKTVVYLVLFGIIAVIITVGVMASIAASYISYSPNIGNADIKGAYDDCIIAAVITLGSIGIALIGAYLTWHTDKAQEQAATPTAIPTAAELQSLALLAA